MFQFDASLAGVVQEPTTDVYVAVVQVLFALIQGTRGDYHHFGAFIEILVHCPQEKSASGTVPTKDHQQTFSPQCDEGAGPEIVMARWQVVLETIRFGF